MTCIRTLLRKLFRRRKKENMELFNLLDDDDGVDDDEITHYKHL